VRRLAEEGVKGPNEVERRHRGGARDGADGHAPVVRVAEQPSRAAEPREHTSRERHVD
jgi:hypothetical protein